MKTLHFQIHYTTQWGQHVQLVYSIDGARPECLPLGTSDGRLWQASLAVNDHARHIRHAYRITDDGGRTLRTEPDSWRIFHFNHRSEVAFADAWAGECLPNLYQRTAFSQCIMLPRGGDKLHMEQLSAPCLLLLHACPPGGGRQWAVVGSTEAWGKWDVRHARPLFRTGTYEYALPLTRSDFEGEISYKYILTDPLNPQHVTWEDGENRLLSAHSLPPAASLVRQDEMPRIRLSHWHGAGVVIPVFSLRSEGSFGIGDLGDLRLFVRWAAECGMQAVQLLPVNDTTRDRSWHDSYPYNAISVFALHPIYIDPREWRNSKAFARYEHEAATLNALPAVDYEAARKLKENFLKDLFGECGQATLRSDAYRKFERENARWLTPYACFCAFRDRYHTANFRSWPEGRHDGADFLKNYHTEDVPEADFHRFVQFLLHNQMQAVHEEAREQGVLLKGDIPIGICPDSVPAWTDGHLFHFDGSAGAPPDAFATHGQNWGFPTYNWEEMAKDGYQWWRDRLAHMEKYFDAYRLDHVLGFFRIWEIPTRHIDGLLGHFRPALPYDAGEIRQAGFSGGLEEYSRPYLSAAHVEELRHNYGAEAVNKFIEPFHDHFTLRPPYADSQRALAEAVSQPQLRRSLLDAATDVLFIADPDRPGLYHPRIGAQQTAAFRQLSEGDQRAFNHLHDHFFYERHNSFWAEEALRKLPAITQSPDAARPVLRLLPLGGTGMLPCAEDLGMVPLCVPDVLKRLGILSLEIQRMPKAYGVRFGNLQDNPYSSVATIATHDMPPLRLWWQEDAAQTAAFWHEALGHGGNPPAEPTPEICEEIVSRHLHSPSMLCLLSLQDWLSVSPTLRNPHPEEEQINVPANPQQYWRYRMHLPVERLIRATDFSEKLRGLIQQTQHG